MSLLVHLPLHDGTLNNYGLSNVTITDNSISNDSGKIGKCREYTTTYSKLSSNVLSAKDKFSICGWIYPTSSNYEFFNIENNAYWQFVLGANKLKCRDNSGGQTGSRADKTITTIPLNTWTHIAVIYNQGAVTIYQNSELKDTLSYPGTSLNAANNFYIGSDAINGTSSYPGNCKVNDFRVYDHCLSEQEVKKLSQGLICHYLMTDTLAETTINLFKDNPNYITGKFINGASDNNIDSAGCFSIITSESGTYTLSGLRKRHTDDTSVNPRLTLVAQYTDDSTQTIASSMINYGYDKADGEWHYFSITGTTDSSKTLKRLYGWIYDHSSAGTKKFEHRYMQLEKKDHATVFTATSRTNCQECDASGLKNNGTCNNITYSTDKVKYKGSYSFNGSSSYINAGKGTFIQGAEELTVSGWFYQNSWAKGSMTRLWSCTESGGYNVEPDSTYGGAFAINVFTNAAQSSYGYVSASCKLTMPLSAGWHMITFTHNASGDKVYVDGEKHSESAYTCYGIHYYLNANLFIGCEANAANPSGPYFGGKASDFRIYATALSADDIKELYNQRIV